MKILIDELLSRGVVEIIEKDHLKKRLENGEKLRVKLGIDPTLADLHLGHTVPLRKLRQFQDAGHTAVLIIGDITALIGDPSGRDKTRPSLSYAQVKSNTKTFERQAFSILLPSQTEVCYQSKWFKKFSLIDLINLASKISTWHLMSHETFADRKDKEFSLMHHETLYPLLQGYDSVAVRADVELGGQDQKFNLLTGRMVQQAYGQPSQDIVMVPYLLGLDGKQKMSKSLGNTINLTDSHFDVFGKVMSISDDLILSYFELVTDLEFNALKKIKDEIESGNPRDVKARLAYLIVEKLFDNLAAEAARDNFDLVFRSRQAPAALNEIKFEQSDINIIDALVKSHLAQSNQQANRLISQGAVKVDGQKITDNNFKIKINNNILQVGKRHFAKLAFPK